MTKKYAILLKLFKAVQVKKIMALPPEKAQKFFKMAYKGVNIPEMSDPEMDMMTYNVEGMSVLWYKHRKPKKKICVYLVGGGMLKYPMPKQARGLIDLAKECDMDIMLPYYPLVFDGAGLSEVYEKLYALYKEVLKRYKAENVIFLGGSSGGNLALGMISYINEQKDNLPKPGKVYAGSPGSLLLYEEEKKAAEEKEKTDVVMSVKAIDMIWNGMTKGKPVPEYMEYLQLGDYTGLKEAYLSFGGDEVFSVLADSLKKRLEECGVHVTLEIADGLYHSYAMMPFVKEAQQGYDNMIHYLKEEKR